MARTGLRRTMAAAALSTSLLAGCGGGTATPKTVSPTEFAVGFCEAFDQWVGGLQQRTADYGANIVRAALSGAEAGKQAIGEFLSGLVALTDQVISRLEATGIPDAPNGKRIVDVILGAFRSGRTAFESARTKVDALSVSSAAEFAAAAQDIGEDIQKVGDRIGKSIDSQLENVESPALEKALSRERACASIG